MHAQRTNETTFQANYTSTPTVSSTSDTLPIPTLLVNNYAATRGVTQVSSEDHNIMIFGRIFSQPWGSYETRNYGPHEGKPLHAIVLLEVKGLTSVCTIYQ